MLFNACIPYFQKGLYSGFEMYNLVCV